MLLQLSISVLFLLLFLLLVQELLAQVVKLNTLAHSLSPYLQNAQSHKHICAYYLALKTQSESLSFSTPT